MYIAPWLYRACVAPILLATRPHQERIHGHSQSVRNLRGGWRGLLFERQRADRIDGQPSTSGKNNYDCSRGEVFRSHGDGPLLTAPLVDSPMIKKFRFHRIGAGKVRVMVAAAGIPCLTGQRVKTHGEISLSPRLRSASCFGTKALPRDLQRDWRSAWPEHGARCFADAHAPTPFARPLCRVGWRGTFNRS